MYYSYFLNFNHGKLLTQCLDIPLPDLDSRKQLLTLNLSGIRLDESVSLDGLAEKLDGYSGADITNVLLCVYLSVMYKLTRDKRSAGMRV